MLIRIRKQETAGTKKYLPSYVQQKKEIFAFILVTFFFSFLLTISKNNVLNALAQAMPAIGAIIIMTISERQKAIIKDSGIFKLSGFKWYLFAITIPVIVIVISYSIATITGVASFSPNINIVTIATLFSKIVQFALMWPLIWAIGEEIGWRGFLQPTLTKILGINKGIIMTGIVWSAWHYIFIFYGGYYESGNTTIDTTLFTITIMAMSFTLGWIRIRSQSIWPCIIFHSASNAAWQIWGYQYKILNSNYIYITGEAGLINILLWSALTLVIVKKSKYIISRV